MPNSHTSLTSQDLQRLAIDVKQWGREAGFQQVGIVDGNLYSEEERLQQWLQKGYQGEMQWLGERAELRVNPQKLIPDMQRVICLRMDYLPADTQQIRVLKDADLAYISRYALGRDYHKVIRKRLAQIAARLADQVRSISGQNPTAQRAFVDSAPVLERPLAARAGLGWIGKHTLLINDAAGSWFFLGEIFTSVPLPVDQSPQTDRCGDCQACLKVCPTDAFPRPYELDARRCISYLTIEHKSAIPEEFREPMGNRIFGCDDCQAICPWNRYASFSTEDDFSPRHQLDRSRLVDLFLWTEQEFLKNTEGSAIRRVGHERWLRNLAVGLGNAATSEEVLAALRQYRDHPSPLVREHVDWALRQHDNPGRRRRRKIRNV